MYMNGMDDGLYSDQFYTYGKGQHTFSNLKEKVGDLIPFSQIESIPRLNSWGLKVNNRIKPLITQRKLKPITIE